MLLFFVIFLTCSVSFANGFNNNLDSGLSGTNDINTDGSTIDSNGLADSGDMSSNSSNSPPSDTSSNAKSPSSVTSKKTSLVAGEPIELSQSAIFEASKVVKSYVVKNGKLPNSVTISDIKFSMPEYQYLVSRAIALKYSKSSSSVTIIWNVKNPSKPSGSNIKKTISKSRYYDLAKRTYKFISKNKKAPNYINSKYGKIQYQTAIFGLAKVAAYISSHNKVPPNLSLNVKKNSKLNKYKPNFKRTIDSDTSNKLISEYNLTANKNGIWVHSGDMKKVDLALLGICGIENIFIHEDIFKKGNQAIDWIQSTSDSGFKVHIWFSTFYNATSKKWTNPIIKGKLNQAYFNKVISRAKYYASISGVAGIHLDYIRYPGSKTNKASKFTYENGKKGDAAITEFVKQLSTAVKPINDKIVLSAALMPEKSTTINYYGQNPQKLGKYLDILIPMLYKGNYKKNTAWIKSTTKWYIQNSGGAEVWGGLYGYYSDTKLKRLSVSKLTTDCISVLKGGGNGIIFFRWGTTNLFNLLGNS